MIEVLALHDPDTPFLDDGEQSLTYGETAARVASRDGVGWQVLRSEPDVDSIVRLLAAMTSGVAVLDPPAGTVETDVGDAVTVVFTSGTSGTPKGVRLTGANWAAAAIASIEHLGHGADDTWLLALPLRHVAGLGIVIRSAYAGGRVRVMPGFDPAEFAAALHGVSVASVVPTMLRRVLDADPGPYRGLRAVLVGGGPIPDGLLERAAEAGLPVLPTYGMTETCGQIATARPGDTPEHKARPLPGVRIRTDDRGVIEVKGAMVSPGYLGEPDREGPWLTTSDLGTIDPDGSLRVMGRVDDVIITGGEKVAPAGVEAVIAALDGVDEAVVVGLPSEKWGAEVSCVYTGSSTVAEVMAGARSGLPAHAVPKRLLRVEAIPLSGPGKPDRAAVAGLLSASGSALAAGDQDALA